MIKTQIESNFADLFSQLMKTDLMAEATPAFGKTPSIAKLKPLLAQGGLHLPEPFRAGYSDPVSTRLDGLVARATGPNGHGAMGIETLTGPVYQINDENLQPQLHRFLAVISNLYRSFLDKTKRAHLSIQLSETLPPLAVFQSDPSNGPFTVPCDLIAQFVGGSVGVVSLPHTFADHPLLYGSLAHETGGHDVVHADTTLLPQLREQLYPLFKDSQTSWLGLLWDYWMDEAVADVYGVLNMGPSFGYNLALLLSAFIGQIQQPPAKAPTLRTFAGPDDGGALDVHPADVLRIALVQGAVEALVRLSASTRAAYSEQLARLVDYLAPDAGTIKLMGLARVTNGKTRNFQESAPLDAMRDAARQVGAMIATTRLDALAGHSVQDIETWDDSDENSAVTIAGRLHAGCSIVGAGDDAQIVAGLTLAAIQHPDRYAAASKLANDALDDSFASDPYWGTAPRDLMITTPSRSFANPEVKVDPYAEEVIDYNPLEEDAADLPGGVITDGLSTVTRHAIKPIPWPDGKAPKIDPGFTFKGADAELPKAEFVFITWTAAEANAMSAMMTPGVWAMPPGKYQGRQWYLYTNQWDAKFRGRSPGRAPAATQHYIGKYMPVTIASRKVLLFKSNFHLARDDTSMPVKDMFKQIIEQTGAELVITTGTAGAIGSKLELGDVMAASQARFKLDGTFKKAPFNGKTFKSDFALSPNGHLREVNGKLVKGNLAPINALLSSLRNKPLKRAPTVYTPATAGETGEPPVIVTTDEFEFDDRQNTFQLQGKGAMVEMDDAVLGLACQEVGHKPQWLAIRNASDPQMPTPKKGDSADIYKGAGYWTSIPSGLACWAAVLDF